MALYPLLAKLPKAPASLSDQLRTILLAAGHVAAGDAEGTVSAFRHIDKSLHGKAYELTIMQAAPLIGVPRTLHSAAALQTLGITGENLLRNGGMMAYEPNTEMKTLKDKGEERFKLVYGRNEVKVRQTLKTFHPGLDEWIQACVYGWTISRTGDHIADGGVSLKERELSTVAMLCMNLSAGVQLASHIRGAVLAGAEVDEVESVIQQSEVLCEAAFGGAMDVWRRYRRGCD